MPINNTVFSIIITTMVYLVILFSVLWRWFTEKAEGGYPDISNSGVQHPEVSNKPSN